MKNPNLSQAPYDISPELLHERETFNLHDHLKGVKPAPATALPQSIRLTNDQLKDLCRAAGIDVVESIKGGRALNQDEVIEELKTENARLTEKCNRLLERAQLAEASAANAISELKSMQRSATVPGNTETPPEETI